MIRVLEHADQCYANSFISLLCVHWCLYLVSMYIYSYIQNNQIVAVENGAFPANIRTM